MKGNQNNFNIYYNKDEDGIRVGRRGPETKRKGGGGREQKQEEEGNHGRPESDITNVREV